MFEENQPNTGEKATGVPPFTDEIPEAIRNIREKKPKFELQSDEAAIIQDESPEIPKTVANPLDDKVVDHHRDNVPTAGIDIINPINEPVLNPTVVAPTIQADNPTNKEIKAEQNQELNKVKDYAQKTLGEKPSGSAPVNPAVALMDEKERKEGVRRSVDIAIYLYGKLKELIGEMFMISPAKMRTMERTKKIKLDWAVDYDEGTNEPFTLRQFILETNKSIAKACETSEEFKTKIRPLLEAEFDKRGLGISSQQGLWVVILEDMINTGRKLFMINKNMNDAVKQIQSEVKQFFVDGNLSERQEYNLHMHQKSQSVPFQQGVGSTHQNDPVFNHPSAKEPANQNPPFSVIKNEEQPVVADTTASVQQVEEQQDPGHIKTSSLEDNTSSKAPVKFTPPTEE